MQALAAIAPDDGAAEDSSDGEEAEEEHPEEDPEYAEEEHPEKDAEHPVEDAEHPVEDADASDSEKSSAIGTTLVLGGDDLAKMSDVETDPINEVPDLSPMSESAEPSDDDDDDCGKANQDPLADTDNESRSPWEKTGYKDKKGRILALVARNPKNGNGPSSSNGSAGGGCRALCEDFFDGQVFCQGEGCVHCQKVFKITPPPTPKRYFVEPKSVEKTKNAVAHLKGCRLVPPDFKVKLLHTMFLILYDFTSKPNEVKAIDVKPELDSYLHPAEKEVGKHATYQTVDTLKVPPIQKPQWMRDCEMTLLGAEPPVVGPQATRSGFYTGMYLFL